MIHHTHIRTQFVHSSDEQSDFVDNALFNLLFENLNTKTLKPSQRNGCSVICFNLLDRPLNNFRWKFITVSQKCERAKYLLLMLVLNFAQCNKFWSGKYAHQHIDHDLMFSQKQQQQKTTVGKKYAEPKLMEYKRASVSICDASRAGINHWRHIFISLTIQFVNYYSKIQPQSQADAICSYSFLSISCVSIRSKYLYMNVTQMYKRPEIGWRKFMKHYHSTLAMCLVFSIWHRKFQ